MTLDFCMVGITALVSNGSFLCLVRQPATQNNNKQQQQ